MFDWLKKNNVETKTEKRSILIDNIARMRSDVKSFASKSTFSLFKNNLNLLTINIPII